MNRLTLNFSTLPNDLNRLETSLLYQRYEAPGIWPLSELDDDAFHYFMTSLYHLTHECLAMHLRRNAPERIPYIYVPQDDAGLPEMIRLTRQLIWCCDMELIYSYRPLARGEYDTIRLLEQTHAQLIGAHYYQRPGEETLAANELHFI